MNNLGEEQLSEQQLFLLGSILEKCVEGAEILANNANTFQYAFRYKKIVDYSDKKFLCSQALATRRLFLMEMKSEKEKKKLMDFFSGLKILLNKIE